MTILLVDSDKTALDREAKRMVIHQSVAMIFLHSSAKDAIRFAMYHDVDLVFTRSVLTEMSGQELIEQIHRFRPEAECYILLKDEEVPLACCQSEGNPASIKSEIYEKTASCEVLTNTKISRQPLADCYGHSCSGLQDDKRGGNRMTEQNLRNLGRKELLEMLIEQGKELEFLKSEYEKDLEFLRSEHDKELAILKKELEESKKALEKKEIAINEAGSIAVAALQINGIFEAAQAASQQYIENIRSLNERQDAICAQRDAESREQADRRLRETTEKCESMEKACQEKCAAMEAQAKQRAEAYWTEVSVRLQCFYENHQELKKLLNFGPWGA
ncbi:MAG: hypothetical protein ACOX60_03205 [Massiliimalia sp.]|jgi:hypothetical protein